MSIEAQDLKTLGYVVYGHSNDDYGSVQVSNLFLPDELQKVIDFMHNETNNKLYDYMNLQTLVDIEDKKSMEDCGGDTDK